MENKTPSIHEEKKRKMLLVFPLLILPFATMLFWVLGGGRDAQTAISEEKKTGFNMLLPNAKLKEDSGLDKMSYYDQAAVDSIKLQEQKKKDPNYALRPNDEGYPESESYTGLELGSWNNKKAGLNTASFKDDNEQQLYQKLQALQKAIAEPPKSAGYGQDMREFQYAKMPYGETNEMKNLEQLMAAMNASSEPDPELAQLGSMLENILDIQHPERVQEKLRKSSREQQKKVYSVSRKKETDDASLLQPLSKFSPMPKQNGFYSFPAADTVFDTENAIQAAVHETQTLINGSIVKIRLTGDIFLSGVRIPRNTFVYGTASLKGERLEIKIEAVRYQNSIFPIQLAVYDLDGIKGIYIPGTINRDVAKASADRSMQGIGLTGISDSWGAQATGIGVEAAKTLLSKKVKLIKVIVKAGYQVLLYDEKQKNDN